MRINREKTFIKRAITKHNGKYDYSKVEYVNAHTKVCIICPEHGEFWQTPNSHLNGCGCPKCSGNIKMNKEEFIRRAKEIHGNKYDYSKVEYKNAKTKVCVICPEHGEFWVSPDNHLRERGCPKCKTRKNLKNKYISNNYKSHVKLATEEFIRRAKEIHGNKYDYSKSAYVNNKTKICIICPIHGEFWIRPDNHLTGQGCKKCGDSIRFNSKKNEVTLWIELSKTIHGDKYDYSKVEYVNSKTKVCIICPEHGEFWQTPASHTSGKGCPVCNESHLERDVRVMLDDEGLKYEYRYHETWLGKLELDFYLPDYKIAIECQGIQHFQPIDFFGGEERFVQQVTTDAIKRHKCIENGVKLLYYSNLKKNNTINKLEILKRKIYEKC